MSDMTTIDLPIKEIAAYCETLPIRRLSMLGPDFDGWLRPDTDIGLLVEYTPGARIGYFDMAGQEVELGTILGTRIDMRTAQELSNHHRQQLVREARCLYAQNSRE